MSTEISANPAQSIVDNGMTSSTEIDSSLEKPTSSSVRSFNGPINLSDFDLGVTLGTGSFGRVRFAIHKVINSIGHTILNRTNLYCYDMIILIGNKVHLGNKNVEKVRSCSIATGIV